MFKTTEDVKKIVKATKGEVIDLSGLSLKGVEFSEVFGENALVKNVNLSGAVLTECDLAGVSFEDVSFEDARFHDCFGTADYTGVTFYKAKIFTSNFMGSNMKHVSFEEVYISNSRFSGVNFYNCILLELYASLVNFEEAVFEESNVEDVRFEICNFSDATFHATPLDKARRVENCNMAGVANGTDFEVVSLSDIGIPLLAGNVVYLPESDVAFYGLNKGTLEKLRIDGNSDIDECIADSDSPKEQYKGLKFNKALDYLELLKVEAVKL